MEKIYELEEGYEFQMGYNYLMIYEGKIVREFKVEIIKDIGDGCYLSGGVIYAMVE